MGESVRVRAVRMRYGLVEDEGARGRGGEWANGRGGEGAAGGGAGVEVPGEGILLVTGASGSGKTTLLRGIEAGLRAAGRGYVRLERMRLPARAVVDCFGGELEEAMGVLVRAGLGEPRLWMRGPRELSEGERFRFRLARWMAGPAGRVLIADEFGNGLDRVTARGVAWQLRRFVEAGGRAAVVATAHEDLAADLGAVGRVRLALGHAVFHHEVHGGHEEFTQRAQRRRGTQRLTEVDS